RNETAREPMAAPNLLIIDAAWFERASETARAALLAPGTPLVILGANALDTRIWQRAMQLDLRPQADGRVAGALALPVAPFNPVAGTWTAGDGTFWIRGRTAWVGVGDWHRLAISQPRQLGMWWQGVLDGAGVKAEQQVAWEEAREMAFAGQRLELCAQGVKGDAVFPSLQQKVSWQRRSDKADALCVAVWPRQAGWLKMEGKGGETYVFDGADWPLWQAAQQRDATTRYLARTAAPAATGSTPLPAWPFALLFTLAMLALWWRERGRRSA
ncbi:MAG: hypothetical protein ABWY27_12290, partial [Telluria sp.]